MKALKASVLIALSVLFFTSCTIERRLYNNGFHVEWKKKYKKSSADSEKEALMAASAQGLDSQEEEMLSQNVASRVEDNVLMDESPVNDNRTEEAYKKSVAAEYTSSTQLQQDKKELQQETTAAKANKESAKHQKKSSGTSGKSQIIALILVLLVGVLGIHRFYLGYPGIGVLMILTAGCCGILALVDLIRIILGDLKPKNGDYSEKL